MEERERKMKIKVFSVIDTNVIISGTISSKSAPAKILQLIRSHNIIPIFDNRMLSEYHEVLNRKKFSISGQTIYDTLYNIVENGILINDVEATKKELRDRKDIPFFEVKESANEFSPTLVTGNIIDFPESSSTVKPEIMLGIMEHLEWWANLKVSNEPDYDTVIENLKKEQLSKSKYTSGKQIIDDLFNIEHQQVNLESRILKLGEAAFKNTVSMQTNTTCETEKDI